MPSDVLNEVLEFNERRGFPGCVGSMDCFNVVRWCGKAMQGQARTGGKEGRTCAGVQIVCAPDRRVLNCHVTPMGSGNDVTKLWDSQLYSKILTGAFGRASEPYQIGNGMFDYLYLLVDDIYPRVPWLMKGERVAGHDTEGSRRFQKELESARKEVECTIGNLQGRFKLIRKGNRVEWTQDDALLSDTILFAVLLHNMTLDLHGYTGAELSANGQPMLINDLLDEHNMVEDEHTWDVAPPAADLAQYSHESENAGEHFRMRSALVSLRDAM